MEHVFGDGMDTVSTRWCPLKEIGSDVFGFANSATLSNKVITLSEQDLLPIPYVEACSYFMSESSLANLRRAEREAKRGNK